MTIIFKSYSKVPIDDRKKWRILAYILGFFIPVYLLFGAIIDYKTLMLDSFHLYRYSGLLGIATALLVMILTNFRFAMKRDKWLFNFFGSFCLFAMFWYILFSSYVYLFPVEIKTYTTEYSVVKYGPRWRFSRCSPGLIIFDPYTSSQYLLCVNQIANKKAVVGQTGKVEITEKINPIGAYLLDYRFISSE